MSDQAPSEMVERVTYAISKFLVDHPTGEPLELGAAAVGVMRIPNSAMLAAGGELLLDGRIEI